MRKLASVLAGIFLVGLSSQAQQVTGVVKDQQGKGLEKSTISLLNAKDSSVIKLAVSADNGRFSVNTGKTGNFLVSVSHVNYVTTYSKVFEVSGSGDVNIGDISLNRMTGELKAITVTAQKPMIEVKADKTVLNVEGTINSTGNDALELLRKSPGVTIDKDDNVSLLGNNGVVIYIDGKPSPLSGTDLTAFLKNLQSSQIEAIEIITNPSAKYDAAGNAGIINIRLKKNKMFGTNGSVNAGYAIGTYPKYNGGLALNNRNKNFNIFGNYNYNHAHSVGKFNLYRESSDTIFDQQNRMQFFNTNQGFKAGIDYFASAKHTLGILVNGTFGDNENRTSSKTLIIPATTHATDRILTANNHSIAERNNVNFNFNYRFTDTAGHELNVDADYGLYRIRTDQYQPNIYYSPDMSTELSRRIYNFITPTDIDLYTIKADYEQNFKGGKLGIGFKSSLVNTNNNFGRYDVNGSTKTLDILRSNHFDYEENINAVYVNFNKAYKKGFMLQAGLRMENTNNNGDSYPLNGDGSINKNAVQTVKRNYTGLFPSAAMTFSKNPMKQWTVSYSRRIDRPSYQDLNPFEFKLDEYTYQKGNTSLRPQYTNSVSVTNVYKYKLTTSLNFSHTDDVFAQLVDTAEKTKAFITKKNLATQNNIALTISYPFMYKNYMVFTNISPYYAMFRADFGSGNRVIRQNVLSGSLFMQHSLKMGRKKDWTAELSGFYNAPGLWQGTFKNNTIWSIDGGVQKTIFKGKGTLKTSVSDIFNSLHFKGTSRFAGQLTVASGSFESRQFKVNFSYRFGSSQVKGARQRKSASDEEQKRTQGGGQGLGTGN
jgi:hypothetical protein